MDGDNTGHIDHQMTLRSDVDDLLIEVVDLAREDCPELTAQ